MANTYTQLHIHVVFAVRYRSGTIQKEWKGELYKYITGIIQTHKHKLLAINGMVDHIHIFFGMRPTQSLSELVQDIKASSSKWINGRRLVQGRFEWQEGFGAFSYSRSQIGVVVDYINNQEAHHAKVNFLDEYEDMLRKFDVEYDKQYIFKPLKD
jgi:putative transposase